MVLNDRTLVLNRSWIPIGTTSVREAILMVCRSAAHFILPDDYSVHDFDSWASLRVAEEEPCIRTVCLRIKIPEVLLLSRYDEYPLRRIPFSRRNIYRRDNYTCQYCGRRKDPSELSVDHVVSRSHGGLSSWSNCVLACLACNRRKGNRTLEEARMRLVQSPKEPTWTPTLSIPMARRKVSWQSFISNQYWNVELDA
ncbi:MAG: HNH endonuclease [Candidatus Eisenbacteria bacterium]|nr:HNH endonuclease [Candidatus Eisenbacteria bacterium]